MKAEPVSPTWFDLRACGCAALLLASEEHLVMLPSCTCEWSSWPIRGYSADVLAIGRKLGPTRLVVAQRHFTSRYEI